MCQYGFLAVRISRGEKTQAEHAAFVIAGAAQTMGKLQEQRRYLGRAGGAADNQGHGFLQFSPLFLTRQES